MILSQLDAVTIKVRAPKAVAQSIIAAPFGAGTFTSVNGNVINPTGQGWFWISAFPGPDSEARLLRDVQALDEAEFNPKP